MAIIDLVAILPYIADLLLPRDNQLRGATLARLLRTFTLLRMERTFKSFKRINLVLMRKTEELLVAAFIGLIMLIVHAPPPACLPRCTAPAPAERIERIACILPPPRELLAYHLPP